MFKFLYLLIFIITVDTTFICSSNHTVILAADELFFFQSSNFLNTLTEINSDNICEINFLLNSNEYLMNKRFYLVLTNIIDLNARSEFLNIVFYKTFVVKYLDYSMLLEKSIPSKFRKLKTKKYFRQPLNMDTVISNQTFYSFKKSIINESFQGFAIFDDWGDNSCPLESISRVKPFFLSDENQIITLNSSYFSNYSRKHPCLWQFAAPSKYGFKIIITSLNLMGTVDLKITNSTDIIWTQHNVRTLHPYYNVDKYLQISLSLETKTEHSAETEFSAYITIVKKEWKNIKCNVLQNAATRWSTPFGYPNNAKCKFELTIPPNIEVLLQSFLDFEKNVDFLQYFSDDNDEKMILESDTVLFGYTKNTSDKNMSFELVSDGSITKGGFDIEFKYIKCECANSEIVVKCDVQHQAYYLMKHHENHDEYDYYCGNLNCNFTIKPSNKCPNKFIVMKIDISFNETFFDSFRIYTNNTVTTEIAFLPTPIRGQWIFNTVLSPFVENVFEAITQPSTDISKTLILSFTPINAPQVETEILLTPEMPNYNVREYFDNQLISAELSTDLLSQGYIMEIYGKLEEVNFYESDNMAHKVTLKQCPYNSDPAECLMTKNKVYAYRGNQISDVPEYLFFHAINRNFSNCLFSNDVFYMAKFPHTDIEERGISALANQNGICTIYFIMGDAVISKLWTSSKNDNIVVYAGNDKEKIFEFNQSTSAIWKNFLPFREYYIFEIPANASLLLSLLNEPCENIIIDSFPYKTVLTFPYTSDLSNSSYQPFQVFIKNFDILITVSKFNISKNYEMILIFENGTEKSFSTFDNIKIFAPTKFTILFDYNSNITDITWEPNVIVFLETIYDPPTTSLSTSAVGTTEITTTKNVKNDTVSNYYCKILFMYVLIYLRIYYK